MPDAQLMTKPIVTRPICVRALQGGLSNLNNSPKAQELDPGSDV